MLDNNKLNYISKKVRFEIIKQTYLKQSGHLGGSLSCTDITVNILNNHIFNQINNQFILSKVTVH